MNLAERMGMGPTRQEQVNPDGTVTITVKAPKEIWPKAEAQSVTLSKAQYLRYLAWRGNFGYIHDVLPDLTRDQREILMSGLTQADLQRLFGD